MGMSKNSSMCMGVICGFASKEVVTFVTCGMSKYVLKRQTDLLYRFIISQGNTPP